jgi:hypothetical protein
MTLGVIILVSAAGTLLLVTAALAAAVGGLFGGRRDSRHEFGPRADDPARDFERAAPRPLGGRPPSTPPADDDGIEIK